MKFIYQYRTPDNKQHRGVTFASTKEAAYANLKAQGIKPGRVEEAPGCFNKLFGKGKRWLAIAGLAVIAATLCVALFRLRKDVENRAQSLLIEDRSQLYGDPVVVAECEAAGWTNVFAGTLERFLAHYAIPGKKVSPLLKLPPEPLDMMLVEVRDSDLVEVAQMKRMVNGMKRELSDYLSAGGNLGGYLKRLDIRQRAERNFYEFRRLKILKTKSHEEWKSMNAELRAKGLPMVSAETD